MRQDAIIGRRPSRTILHEGERVLYAERPVPRMYVFRVDDRVAIPNALAFLAVAAIMTVVLVPFGASLPLLWLILGGIIAFGLHLNVGRFALRWWQARTTTYLVTERRLIVEGPWASESFDLATLPYVGLDPRERVPSTIRFGSQRHGTPWYYPKGRKTLVGPALYGVTDADRVYRLINEVHARARRDYQATS